MICIISEPPITVTASPVAVAETDQAFREYSTGLQQLVAHQAMSGRCNKRPLSIFILESRWRLFCHILRRDSQIPANQAMSGYFVTEGSKFKGRPLTTLPVVLNRDLSRIINSNLQLKSSHDLEHLRSIAQQRDEWTKLTARIREAAEASQSEH
ncbi:hypothetical protein ElyMa_000709700 [Elysia marginata]|uniref:Uncharacterized protein n=1 Tax=Elysia marginata TaxID=1093978 RepID=A0AAV4GL65_9GAST|nr:hypothetical protein ElyMa_000709700 [Elysia marginata]